MSGLVFFLVLLDWLRVLGPDAWVLLSLLCAAFWAAAGALLPTLLRRRWWVLSVPLLWVVMEALRERVPFGGFPWGRLAFGQADTALVGWAVIGGPAAVTFAVALGGCALLVAWDEVRAGRPRSVIGALLLVGVVVGAGSVIRLPDWGGPSSGQQPIAVVQGNVPRRFALTKRPMQRPKKGCSSGAVRKSPVRVGRVSLTA